MQAGWVRAGGRQWRWIVWLGAAATLAGAPCQAAEPLAQAAPQIAVYYGSDVPVPELQAFDWVVLDPARVDRFDAHQPAAAQWLARVDLTPQVDAMRGDGWPDTAIERLFVPLLAQGYKGFLLDGLDALQRSAPQTANAVAALVQALHARMPEARLLAGGTAWLDTLAPQLAGVVMPGLVRERADDAGGLREVSDADRAARIATLRRIGEQYRLPAIALDYCASYDRACLRDTANVARAAGVTSYATTPSADMIGIGRLEVMPRRVLLVEPQEPGTSANTMPAVLYLAMPINYLGYRVEFADAYKPLPTVTPDRYAGVVTWFDGNAPRPGAWATWLRRTMGAGVRVAMFNQFGMAMDAATARSLGLKTVPGTPSGALTIVSRDPMVGFELQPHPERRDAVGVRVDPNLPQAQSLLRLSSGSYTYDAAAILPWGGYVLRPFGVFRMPEVDQARWVIQPLDFLRRALALPAMPVPDTTTENGRRLMTVHVDGDGFASRTEFSPSEFAGQTLLREIWARYRVPTTVSIIEGEVSAEGMYPRLAPQLESVARTIFAEPYVEVASHTFSHPFNWLRTVGAQSSDESVDDRRADTASPSHTVAPAFNGSLPLDPTAPSAPSAPPKSQSPEPLESLQSLQALQALQPSQRPQPPTEDVGSDVYGLNIPHYHFSFDREIAGSIHYINTRLAPPGKPVRVLLWSGNGQVPPVAVRKTVEAGVLNMNGGDTYITRTNPSWTAVAPLGVDKGDGLFQVFAPAQNENIYTNLWHGPYYGFSRVIETFELTDRPLRLKPLGIYYHMYSGTKVASLAALRQVYDWALAQPVMPVYASDYIRKVLDFRNFAVARDGDAWVVRGDGDLRTVRWNGAGVPRLADARDVAGFAPAGGGGTYIHLASGSARFAMDAGQEALPYVREASGRLTRWQRSADGRTLSVDVAGYVRPFIRFVNAARCRATVDGREVAGAHGDDWRIDLGPGNPARLVAQHVELVCGR
ncbi:bifunctional glycoside hydrolase 114/ polysaccharide deacetylase family protein [Ralstonia solanacearum]|uniref:bifunctional glycoside hydrolase 114/ polysaccharide deacetylase family protein n=1 Tax=Ralstonia solanacearum TaxID=305 RepID=UPI00078B6FA0|nr:bifunctional glycoside hydrolase 114/ polysaccharide deacetylase family protein [Ralstonia solanacearum]AMP36284.1 hypothetical protein LBM2029_01440 [Ralstonia solanacearum]AXV85078.1 hypothetical protein CJO78_01510 [Ralstonia solanacearum]AXW04569.1 hypothetical protein CJO82_01165 [Ralstonia solanacearum]AXW22322.1 hypothetical protein CJO86_01165 [Ralstonia solanacearum]AXW79280.1 hypothetical protein CJO98_01530 [Ralstonia solanacearum]